MSAENDKPYILYTKSNRFYDAIVDVNKIILYIRNDIRWISTGGMTYKMYGEDTYNNKTPLSEEELFLELL